MIDEQLQKMLEEAEKAVEQSEVQSKQWNEAVQTAYLARLALHADKIGDIQVTPEPRYNNRQPEFNRPDNLAVYVKDEKINYLIDEVDIALLFGLAFKYLERNDAPRFVAFAARMLGIESEYAKIHRPDDY